MQTCCGHDPWPTTLRENPGLVQGRTLVLKVHVCYICSPLGTRQPLTPVSVDVIVGGPRVRPGLLSSAGRQRAKRIALGTELMQETRRQCCLLAGALHVLHAPAMWYRLQFLMPPSATSTRSDLCIRAQCSCFSPTSAIEHQSGGEAGVCQQTCTVQPDETSDASVSERASCAAAISGRSTRHVSLWLCPAAEGDLELLGPRRPVLL